MPYVIYFLVSYKSDYLIFKTNRASLLYLINIDSLSKSVNGYIRVCWPYRGVRMLAVGLLCWPVRRFLSRVAVSAFSQWLSFSSAFFGRKLMVLNDCCLLRVYTRNRIVSTDSKSRRYRQSVHPMCSALYLLLNLSKAAFRVPHRPVLSK